MDVPVLAANVDPQQVLAPAAAIDTGFTTTVQADMLSMHSRVDDAAHAELGADAHVVRAFAEPWRMDRLGAGPSQARS